MRTAENSIPLSRPKKRKPISFVFLGRKENKSRNAVSTWAAGLEWCVTAVGLFSVLAMIMNDVLKEK